MMSNEEIGIKLRAMAQIVWAIANEQDENQEALALVSDELGSIADKCTEKAFNDEP